jgi:hypothetical protein
MRKVVVINVNYKLTLALFLAVIVLIGVPMVAARPTYFAAFKEKYNTGGTKLDSCNTCHTSGGGSPRNPYGIAYSENGKDFTSIENLDSDNDGFTNIEEINAQTFPGGPNDYPQTTNATPIGTTTNVTQQQQNSEVPISNRTQEKPTTEVATSNTTNVQKSSGFEAILAVVGFLTFVYLNRKYV